MSTKRLGFADYVKNELKKPSFAAAYEKAGREIEAVDGVIRAIDEARLALDIPKAELARRVAASPVVIRRLLTAKEPNPSFATILELLHAVGLTLTLTSQPQPKPASTHRRKRAGDHKRVA